MVRSDGAAYRDDESAGRAWANNSRKIARMMRRRYGSSPGYPDDLPPLTEIRNRLDKAAGIGRAADACAGAGFHEKGLEVALDIEQLLYEAATLLNAASLTRIARQS
jgi:hypothetical protein